MKRKINAFNEKIAVKGASLFGSMWTTYIFCIWGLLGMLPHIPEHFSNFVLMVSSSWLQLFALPLISVGNAVNFRIQERRAKQDHNMIKAELEKLDLILGRLDKIETNLTQFQGALERIERFLSGAA